MNTASITAASMDRICIHTATTRPLPLEVALSAYAAAGVSGITVWRDAFGTKKPAEVGRLIERSGITPVSLCRGGFFVHPAAAARKTATLQNRTLLREAAEIGAPLLVLVCGAHQEVELSLAREQILDGISSLLPLAEELGVRLAIEPLHPMFADTRSAVNTIATANEMTGRLDHRLVGVAVDVYHLWWDPQLEAGIREAGDRIFAYHVSDWRSPTRDLLNDRGLMGEGCIPLKQIRSWTEAAGFSGFNEVEIFSTEFWATDQQAYIDRIVTAYKNHV